MSKYQYYSIMFVLWTIVSLSVDGVGFVPAILISVAILEKTA